MRGQEGSPISHERGSIKHPAAILRAVARMLSYKTISSITIADQFANDWCRTRSPHFSNKNPSSLAAGRLHKSDAFFTVPCFSACEIAAQVATSRPFTGGEVPQRPWKQTGGTDGCLRAHRAYPAVVVDETQPLHGHIAHVTPTKQDFSWGRGKRTDF